MAGHDEMKGSWHQSENSVMKRKMQGLSHLKDRSSETPRMIQLSSWYGLGCGRVSSAFTCLCLCQCKPRPSRENNALVLRKGRTFKKKKFIQYKKQLGDEPKPAGGKMWVVLIGNLGHLYVLLHVTLRDRVMPGWSVSCWL